MMKSLPRPWYLTKWSARSDSRRSRNEAADLGADTAIEATARRGAAGDPRGGRRTRPRDGAVGLGVATETAGKAVAAAAGDMADRAGAGPRERVRVGFGRGWRVRGPVAVAVRVIYAETLRSMEMGPRSVWPTVIDAEFERRSRVPAQRMDSFV